VTADQDPEVERLAELAAVDSLVAWVANRVSEIALWVPRLLVSIATGDGVSKTEAGRYPFRGSQSSGECWR
jgi:hypothetical protein